MSTRHYPVFRKEIYPWYLSKTTYYLVIIFMFLVFLFGLAGISVTHENYEYSGYVWLPLLLLFMSGISIVIATIRLVRRYTSGNKMESLE